MLTPSRTLTAISPAIPKLLGSDALIPVKLSGSEGVNSLFEYRLILKTPDSLNAVRSSSADVNRDDFIGHELTVKIELDGSGSFIPGAIGQVANVGAGTREITGVITEIRFLREEGRHVWYEATLQPWFYLATLRTNTKVYQDMTVVNILDEVLADYNFPTEKYLLDTYPKRDFQLQYNESDFDFFCRLCQEWGINYYFSHSDGKHRLVLIDNVGGFQHTSSSAYHQLNFYTPGYVIDEEFVHSFMPANQLTSGKYSARDYDHTRSAINLEANASNPRPTQQNQHEVYEWHQGAHFSQPEAGMSGKNDPDNEGEFLARRRMQELRTAGHRAHGAGHLRGIVSGCVFTLNKHPSDSANAEWIVINTTFTIEEIAQETQPLSSLRPQEFKFYVEFEVQPTSEELRPVRTIQKPYTRGPEIARVVGPANENIWTDSYGRIKVQFPFDRIGNNDQNSSCWVRVNQSDAGNQHGSMHVPRIGEEVIVDFIGGDPDLPICTGRVYNQMNMPPWSLPDQSALSGFRSRELTPNGGNAAAGRSNHLILDDSENKIQAQLKSDHQHSQLSLGHITRIEDKDGRKDYRGEGMELRTDGHGVIRAKDGMLITTEGRSNAQSHIKDMGETVQRLTQASDQHESLADLAQQNKAQDTKADQSDVAKTIKAQNDAIKGSGKEGQFPELAEPHLVLASPAGIETTTPQSTHIASGEHIAMTSGGHTSLSIGNRLLASVRNGIRLFTYKAGIKLVAAAGDIDIQALQDNIHILAKLNITETANRITLTAKEEVVINGGGSYTKWTAGGIESGTSGSHVVHAASHSLIGAKSVVENIPITTTVKEGPHAIQIMAHSAEGNALKNATLILHSTGQTPKKISTQTLSDSGTSTIVSEPQNHLYHGLIGYDEWVPAFMEVPQEIDDAINVSSSEMDEDRSTEHLQGK